MSTSRRRSTPVPGVGRVLSGGHGPGKIPVIPGAPGDEELRLPQTPGAVRRFWARHPWLADVLIALFCLALSSTTNLHSPGPVAAIVMQIAVLVGCALLVKRRQWPVVTFVAAWLVTATYLLQNAPVGGPILLIAAYSLAVYRSSRACWWGLAIGLSALTTLCFALWASGALPFSIAANAVVGALVLGLVGSLIGVNVGNRKRYLEAVIDRSRQLLVERDQQAQLAAAAERERIAREMHDIVSHSLTVVVALSEGAAATPDRDRARAASTAAAATARNALGEMRSMLGVLRDGDADAPLAPLDPITPAATIAGARQAGFTATLAVRGDAEIAPALRFAIGRIVQEGVTNAMRHAPQASGIDVRIDYDADPIVVEIVNDGVRGSAVGTGSRGDGSGSIGDELGVGSGSTGDEPGIGPGSTGPRPRGVSTGPEVGSTAAGPRASPRGFGLRGLAERANLLGGRMISAPAGRERWMLRAELPGGGAAVVDEADDSAPTPSVQAPSVPVESAIAAARAGPAGSTAESASVAETMDADSASATATATEKDPLSWIEEALR